MEVGRGIEMASCESFDTCAPALLAPCVRFEILAVQHGRLLSSLQQHYQRVLLSIMHSDGIRRFRTRKRSDGVKSSRVSFIRERDQSTILHNNVSLYVPSVDIKSIVPTPSERIASSQEHVRELASGLACSSHMRGLLAARVCRKCQCKRPCKLPLRRNLMSPASAFVCVLCTSAIAAAERMDSLSLC